MENVEPIKVKNGTNILCPLLLCQVKVNIYYLYFQIKQIVPFNYRPWDN